MNIPQSKNKFIKSLKEGNLITIPSNYKKILNKKLVSLINSLFKDGTMKKVSIGKEDFLLFISENSMDTVETLSDKYKIADSGRCYMLLKRGKKEWVEEPSSGPVPKNKLGLSRLRREYKELIS